VEEPTLTAHSCLSLSFSLSSLFLSHYLSQARLHTLILPQYKNAWSELFMFLDALQLFHTLSRGFTWINVPEPECPVRPIGENRWTPPISVVPALQQTSHSWMAFEMAWGRWRCDMFILFFCDYHSNLIDSACVANLKGQCLRRDNDVMYV